MEFLLPLLTYYALMLLPFCLGLLACVGAYMSRRRHHWVLVAGSSAVLAGSWVIYQYKAILWGATDDASWFIVVVGLTPIILGSVSLVRWSQMKA